MIKMKSKDRSIAITNILKPKLIWLVLEIINDLTISPTLNGTKKLIRVEIERAFVCKLIPVLPTKERRN